MEEKSQRSIDTDKLVWVVIESNKYEFKKGGDRV